MNDSRLGGIALIAGALGGIVTMALHPSGHDLFDPDAYDRIARISRGVHALAIASVPLVFLGGLALTRRIDTERRYATVALVLLGFSGVCTIIAAAISGFISTDLIGELLKSKPADEQFWRALLNYSFRINQTFAMLHTVGSTGAIVLWSVAMLSTRLLHRGIAIYGLLIGSAIILVVGSGTLPLDVHGFGLVTLLQTFWFVATGVQLMRLEDA